MADLKYYDIIQKPIITEKSMTAMEEKKYTFAVHPEATKSQIKEAVEKLFEGAKVAKVNKGYEKGEQKWELRHLTHIPRLEDRCPFLIRQS